MSKRSMPIRVLTAVLLAASQMPCLAAGGAGEPIVFVADSRPFTGWKAWLTNLYNESHFYFALLTIVSIPLLGLTLGKATGFLMARLGINLKSRVLSEH